MEKYGERVAAARSHARWSQERLAKELGVTQPAVHQLEKSDATGSKHSYKIAQATGVRMEWLENNAGNMLPAPSLNEPERKFEGSSSDQIISGHDLTNRDINVQSMPRDVPILGGASCGEAGLFEFNGQTLDYARRPPRLQNVKDAYAVYVSGDSMSPWRENGDLVYVQPHQPPKINDYVVVQIIDKEGELPRAYIKRLSRRTEKELRLQQFKPPGEMTLPMKKVKSVHRIIDWQELMGL